MKTALVLLCCFIVGCTSQSSSTGDANVQIAASALSSVAKVTVTVSGPGMTDMSTDLALVGASWQGTLDSIPTGTGRVFTAIAYDASNVPLYQGTSAPVEIVAGQTATVILALQSTMPPPAFGNHAPHIDAVYVSATMVAPGDAIQLIASASDADGDPLVVAWTGGGAFATASALMTTWTAPPIEADIGLTLTVTDPYGASDGISLTIHVTSSSARGAAAISVAFNSFPQVTNLTLDAGEIVPGLFATATTVASDPDGDLLTYQYSDSCHGSWSGNHVTYPVPLDAGATCTITVTVDDGRGGINHGSLVVGTDALDAFVETFASAASVDGGGKITFHVRTRAAMPLHWVASQGTFDDAADASNTQYMELTWTAPTCFQSDATISVEAYPPGQPVNTMTWTIHAAAENCGLIAWWNGESDVDTVGGRTLAKVSVNSTASIHGQGYAFSLETSSMTASDFGFPVGASDRTIEFWVRHDARLPYENFFFGYGGFGVFGGAVTMGESGSEPFTSTWGPNVYGGGPILNNTFHHMAMTTSSGVVSLYVDGALMNSSPLALNTTSGAGAVFGHWNGPDGGTRGFIGVLDDIRVWNRALSASELAAIYAAH